MSRKNSRPSVRSQGEQHTYPFTVTTPNGRTQLHITQAMGEKAIKAVVKGVVPEDAAAEDLLCYQYLLW